MLELGFGDELLLDADDEDVAEQETMDTSTRSSSACFGFSTATGNDSIFFSVAESHWKRYTSAFSPVSSDFMC